MFDKISAMDLCVFFYIYLEQGYIIAAKVLLLQFSPISYYADAFSVGL